MYALTCIIVFTLIWYINSFFWRNEGWWDKSFLFCTIWCSIFDVIMQNSCYFLLLRQVIAMRPVCCKTDYCYKLILLQYFVFITARKFCSNILRLLPRNNSLQYSVSIATRLFCGNTYWLLPHGQICCKWIWPRKQTVVTGWSRDGRGCGNRRQNRCKCRYILQQKINCGDSILPRLMLQRFPTICFRCNSCLLQRKFTYCNEINRCNTVFSL